MRLRSTLGVALLSVTLWTGAAEVTEYQLKAEFIERFTRFIEWPDESVASREPFVIGIVGRDPFGEFLTSLAEKRTIKNRRVVVRHLDRDDELGSCDVLFVSSSEKEALAEILRATASKPVLTVGDTRGYAEAGVVINFYPDGDNVRFEINERAAKASGLDIQAKLLKLARIVEGEKVR